jgi:hypothetical protein
MLILHIRDVQFAIIAAVISGCVHRGTNLLDKRRYHATAQSGFIVTILRACTAV